MQSVNEDQAGTMYVNWHDVRLWVKAIVDQILSGPKPDAIVAIGMGGLIPAGLLHYEFGKRAGDTPQIGAFYAHSYKDQEKGQVVLGPRPTFQDVHNVLIVDDIADSGETLKEVTAFYPRAQTATLIYKETSIFKPDFYGHKDVDGKKWWYVFPWEQEN